MSATGGNVPNSGKYFMATFGCQMNVYDSNLIGGMLEKRGMSATGEADEADVLIVNTDRKSVV